MNIALMRDSGINGSLRQTAGFPVLGFRVVLVPSYYVALDTFVWNDFMSVHYTQ